MSRSQAQTGLALIQNKMDRFLNVNPWSTRQVIRTALRAVLKQILSNCPRGRRPMLQVIIDLTTLEKRGKLGGRCYQTMDVLTSTLRVTSEDMIGSRHDYTSITLS